MKRVLLLAYYFPPHGGAGVQRTVKFLKHLSAFGYEGTVVTGPVATILDFAPPDETLAADVGSVAVSRVSGPEPHRSNRWRSRAERWLGVNSPFSRWWVDGATAVGRDLAATADVVYASMSPFETAEAASRIAADTGKPWVADLRDPWALDDWTVFPTALHRRIEERRMGRLLKSASAVVLNSAEAAAAVRDRLPELGSMHIATIPNGWDAGDFERPVEPRADGSFRIVYVGYAHIEGGGTGGRGSRTVAALGGTVPGLVALARSHVFLLDAVDALVARDPTIADRIEIHLAGAHKADRRTSAHPLVRFHGYLPHHAAIDLMRTADLLFLPMQDLATGVRTRTVPGKTYEYLAAERPILGALPEGDARDLLADLPFTFLCRPRDSRCMAAVIDRCLRDGPRGPVPRPADLLARFERRELTRQLAEVLDSAISRGLDSVGC